MRTARRIDAIPPYLFAEIDRKVTERKASVPKPFEEVREEVRQRCLQERRQERTRELVRELQANAVIEEVDGAVGPEPVAAHALGE